MSEAAADDDDGQAERDARLAKAVGFVISSRDELSSFFDPCKFIDENTTDPAQLRLLAQRGTEFESLGRKLLERWTSILVSSGVVEFAVEGLRRFGLGNFAAGVALRILARAADEGPSAHALLISTKAAQLAVSIAKANPETARVQFCTLYLVAAIDDDLVREEVAQLGLFRSAIMAYRDHLFSEHGGVSMPTVRPRGTLIWVKVVQP